LSLSWTSYCQPHQGLSRATCAGKVPLTVDFHQSYDRCGVSYAPGSCFGLKYRPGWQSCMNQRAKIATRLVVAPYPRSNIKSLGEVSLQYHPEEVSELEYSAVQHGPGFRQNRRHYCIRRAGINDVVILYYQGQEQSMVGEEGTYRRV
jgi:hypothetical protein